LYTSVAHSLLLFLLLFSRITALALVGSGWRLWSCARPKYDNNTRYQFLCYTKDAPAAPASSSSSSSRGQDLVGQPPVLPPGIASKHDEYQVGAV
jgi:hypothetical protein